MRLLLAIALAGLVGRAGLAREGLVRTTDGATLRGVVAFETNGLSIRPEAGDALRMDLDRLVELTLSGSGTNAPDGSSNSTARTAVGDSASAWNLVRIGGAPPGRAVPEDEIWALSGGGLGLRGNSDSGVLAGRRLEASGQILARLESFESGAAEAMAGLMLRDNEGESAAYAFVGQRHGVGLCFQYRQIAGGMTMRTTNVALTLPAWLRLSRVGGAVVAEVSGDGQQWQPLGRANVNLGQRIAAGLAVTSGADDTTVTARFRNPLVGARGLGYVPSTGYPRLLFRGGSVLVGPIESANESVVRLGDDWKGSMVSVLNLARIDFVPLTPELRSRLDPERVGALLVDGDFLDGSLRGVATNSVTMSSLLFGFRQFAVGSEVGFVQFAPVETVEEPYHVTLVDGSDLRVRTLELRPGAVRVESPLLGSLVLPEERVRQIRRGGMER